ncbi:MAG: apolipoprotein N-acyltransferase [Thermodesulfobacteriota bacterium]
MTRRLILPALAGVLLAASFPPVGLGWLAWVALVPLLAALDGQPWRQGALSAFVFGFVYFLGTVYWVVNSMFFYGGISLTLSVPIMLLLVAFLALYPAAFGLFLALVGRGGRVAGLLAAPTAWTALELLRSHMFTGFPWALVGYTQARVLPVIQIADVFGVWGVSFLVVAVNAVLALWLRRLLAGRRGAAPVGEAVAVAVMLTLTIAYGFMRIGEVDERAGGWEGLTVGVAQGSIDQSVKWDPSRRAETIGIYSDLSRRAASEGAGLIVWPETAVPFYLGAEPEDSRRVEDAARTAGAYILTGSPSFSFPEKGSAPEFFNSAYLLDPGGTATGRYDKVHLVPFGEYVPMRKVLFFISKLTEGVGDFTPGPGPIPITFRDSGLGVLICYESIFPELARRYAARGAGLLVVITNDAWFGRTSAPYQHFEMAVMRAVENRTYLVRAANTGISGVIDPAGRVKRETSLFERTVFTERVALRGGPVSVYTAWGDVFAYLCLVFSGALVLRKIFSKGDVSRCSKR